MDPPSRTGMRRLRRHLRRAALANAAKVASEIDEGVIVFIVCDGGWKYLSTGAYTDDLDAATSTAEQIIYF